MWGQIPSYSVKGWPTHFGLPWTRPPSSMDEHVQSNWFPVVSSSSLAWRQKWTATGTMTWNLQTDPTGTSSHHTHTHKHRLTQLVPWYSHHTHTQTDPTGTSSHHTHTHTNTNWPNWYLLTSHTHTHTNTDNTSMDAGETQADGRKGKERKVIQFWWGKLDGN